MSAISTDKTKSSTETDSQWYPWELKDQRPVQKAEVEDFVNRAIQSQRIQFENKMLDIRNENILLRHEILSLKETIIKLEDNYGKLKQLKPVLDERKKNELIRRHISFPFIPDARSLTTSRSTEP